VATGRERGHWGLESRGQGPSIAGCISMRFWSPLDNPCVSWLAIPASAQVAQIKHCAFRVRLEHTRHGAYNSRTPSCDPHHVIHNNSILDSTCLVVQLHIPLSYSHKPLKLLIPVASKADHSSHESTSVRYPTPHHHHPMQ